jgi:site-specific recombinase XerC
VVVSMCFVTLIFHRLRENRVVPLVGQALEALKAYLAVREVSPEYDNVFLARNKTSMDQRTVRYRIQKYYKEAGIGQVREVLEILVWESSLEGFALKPILASYS